MLNVQLSQPFGLEPFGFAHGLFEPELRSRRPEAVDGHFASFFALRSSPESYEGRVCVFRFLSI